MPQPPSWRCCCCVGLGLQPAANWNPVGRQGAETNTNTTTQLRRLRQACPATQICTAGRCVAPVVPTTAAPRPPYQPHRRPHSDLMTTNTSTQTSTRPARRGARTCSSLHPDPARAGLRRTFNGATWTRSSPSPALHTPITGHHAGRRLCDDDAGAAARWRAAIQ